MQKVLQEFIDKYKEQINEAIEQELARRLIEVKQISPHLVKVLTAMQELSVGGKRLRGLLTVLGYELAGQKVDEAIIRAGAVMEIFHLGLLIQDDWMDRDSLRRGVATLHTRYDDTHTGNFVAMLAGDYTFGWGMEMLSGLALPARQVNAGMAVWGKYFTRVGYGQTLDGLAVADEETILKILSIKSGEYSCVLPLVLGATLGGADKVLLDRLKQYGVELGWVFQLRDDWLAEYGDSEQTGKPVGNDSREGKRTFVTLYGREKTEQAIAQHMQLGMKLSGDSEILQGLVEWMGTRER